MVRNGSNIHVHNDRAVLVKIIDETGVRDSPSLIVVTNPVEMIATSVSKTV